MSLDSSVLSEGSVSGDQSGHEAADLTTKAINICAVLKFYCRSVFLKHFPYVCFSHLNKKALITRTIEKAGSFLTE